MYLSIFLLFLIIFGSNGQFKKNTGYGLGQTSEQSYGHNSGQTLGQSSGYSSSQTSGQSYGQNSGQTSGFSSGQTSGQTSGFSSGQTSGQTSGFSSGQSYGQINRPINQGFNRPKGEINRPNGDGTNRPNGDGTNRPNGDGTNRPNVDGTNRPDGDSTNRPDGEGYYRPNGEGYFRPNGEGYFRPNGEGYFRPNAEGYNQLPFCNCYYPRTCKLWYEWRSLNWRFQNSRTCLEWSQLQLGKGYGKRQAHFSNLLNYVHDNYVNGLNSPSYNRANINGFANSYNHINNNLHMSPYHIGPDRYRNVFKREDAKHLEAECRFFPDISMYNCNGNLVSCEATTKLNDLDQNFQMYGIGSVDLYSNVTLQFKLFPKNLTDLTYGDSNVTTKDGKNVTLYLYHNDKLTDYGIMIKDKLCFEKLVKFFGNVTNKLTVDSHNKFDKKRILKQTLFGYVLNI